MRSVSIFHSGPFPPRYSGLTFSGCGHVSPLQNDPELRIVGVGTMLLFNGGEGFAIAAGTRSSTTDSNLMTIADLKNMDPTLIGGFMTGAGPECICSYAVPIPILDDKVLRYVLTKDKDIPLPVADLRDRKLITTADYGQVWSGTDLEMNVIERRCTGCEPCIAETSCPTGAIAYQGDCTAIDPSRCFSCGTCVATCPRDCFEASLGHVKIKVGDMTINVPVICRQSSMTGALRTAEDLKRSILDGRFALSQKVADIRP